MTDTLSRHSIDDRTEQHRRWDWLRGQSIDLVDGIERLSQHVMAFRCNVEHAYAYNSEMVPEPGEEDADLAMLNRLLNHVEQYFGYIGMDLPKLRERLAELGQGEVDHV